MTRRYAACIGAIVFSAVMTGCGGGSGNAGKSASRSTAEVAGLYHGVINTNRAITSIVLEDGTYYALYSVANDPSLIAGALQGTGVVLNDKFTASNVRDINLEGGGVLVAAMSVSFVEKQSFNGSLTYPAFNQRGTFSSTYSADYELTANLVNLAGTYTATVGSPSGAEEVNLTVSTSGAVSGVSAGGCTFSGAMTPAAKGNTYSASISFDGAPCLFSNMTVSGGAYFDAPSKHLYAVALSPARDNGLVFLGIKS